jgi:hypothetical protein
VAVAWFAVKGEEGHAYAAFSRDAGRSFGEPIRLDDAVSVGHVGIEMLPGGSPRPAGWSSPAGARGCACAVSSRRARVQRPWRSPGPAPALWGPPRIARAGNELVLAWTESQSEGDEDLASRSDVATATLPESSRHRVRWLGQCSAVGYKEKRLRLSTQPLWNSRTFDG